MNKKLLEYLIIAAVILILIYSCYALMTYKYLEYNKDVSDSIKMYYPASSEYKVVGDTVEFKNTLYDFYNMNVSKVNSQDARLTNLLNHFADFTATQSTVDYKNESCYLLTTEFEDGSGFKYHSMIIPVDSFNKDNLSFNKNSTVYLFDGNNREFVVDTAFNSQVVL